MTQWLKTNFLSLIS